MRSVPLRTIVALVAFPLGLAACGGGTADLDDLASTLEEIAEHTPEQAQCVATDIREAGKYTEDEINDFSDGKSDDPVIAAKISDFENEVAQAVTDCGGA